MFLVTILLLVIILLVAKKYLSPSGNVNIVVNGDRTLSVGQGSSLMTTLNENGIYLPPSSTCTLHCPHDALPPQADGR